LITRQVRAVFGLVTEPRFKTIPGLEQLGQGDCQRDGDLVAIVG
jgi:hypothetical protein